MPQEVRILPNRVFYTLQSIVSTETNYFSTLLNQLPRRMLAQFFFLYEVGTELI